MVCSRSLLLLALLALAACGRPQATGFSQPVPEATVQTIYVATLRLPSQRGAMFGKDRSDTMTYARANISIPPGHETGQIERGSGRINATHHFAPLSVTRLNGNEALAKQLANARTAQHEPLLLYVHGYNNTLEDAAFRLAQIQHDFDLPNPSLLFAWPSAGDPLGYAYDRDSVLFARSDLAQLLETLNRTTNSRIILLGHSLGSHLVMEALRQLALEGKSRPLAALDAVVLMSPDIDPDVFRKQAREIGPLPQPFVIMTSQKDRVLNLAALLTGDKTRLGRLQDNADMRNLNVTVLDFSPFEAGTSAGHMVPVSSPAAIRFLRRLTDGAGQARTEFSQFALQKP